MVVNDKRRIDPATGQLRGEGPFPGGPGAGPGGDPGDPFAASQPLSVTPEPSAELEAARQEAAERTADLQRVSAEYANYRKRVDRDREQVSASARERVLTELLPVLDDIDRADSHGDVTGAFKAVADKLLATAQRLGLQRFGAEGEPFDPALHEAVHFATSPAATEQSVAAVLRHGYRVGDRVVRVAVVAVVGPGDEPGADDAVAAQEVVDEDAVRAEASAAVEDVDQAAGGGDRPAAAGGSA
ncbi:nucleotide exchange factor GrpE [Nakamurella endophytica]|uniref:nucleotide exchange factor GrpE n=1 Tax=Nakamurella endophytica TaxID=1748367 RepID=UPI001E4ADDEF|nr:nucleotide exchange factor GrpE [Nakamurella endophytica]